MKTKSLLILKLPSLATGVFLSCIGAVSAAEPVKEIPTAEAEATKAEITATGTVFSVEPDTLSVVMKDNPTPVRFSYDKSTPFLDENGTVVPMDLVRVELPVTVHYRMEGDKMSASRVVMSRSMVAGDAAVKPDRKRQDLAAEKAQEASQLAEIEKNPPQEVMGTVSTIEQTISIVARGEKTPSTCIINNSTRFVNLSGQPVSPQLLMGGMAVTVKSIRDGKRVIAQEIVIRGDAAALAAGQRSIPNASGNPNANGEENPQGKSRGGGNSNSGGGSNGLPNLPGNPGYVVPGQLPGLPIKRPETPGNSGVPGNPETPGNPNQPGTRQPDTTQPGNPQPPTKQPETPPAGGNRNPNGTNDANGNGSGNNGGNSGAKKTNASGGNGTANKSASSTGGASGSGSIQSK